MTLAADLAADYAYQDGIESVTFTDLDGNATANVQAVRGGLNHREALLAAGGAYEPSDMTWDVWSATLGGETPSPGCKITDAGAVAYTVISAVETTHGTTSIRWRCVCRRQR